MASTFTFRVHMRIKTRCILQYFGTQVHGTGTVHDVSIAGWRVVGDQRVTQGDILALTAFLPLVAEPVEIESASVRWVKGREFGLHIIKMSPFSQTTIKAFLHRISESGTPMHPKGCAESERIG